MPPAAYDLSEDAKATIADRAGRLLAHDGPLTEGDVDEISALADDIQAALPGRDSR